MKDKTTAGVLGVVLGGIGVHKFYLGQTAAGIAYAVFCWTGIPAIIGLIEGIAMLTMSQGAFDAKYNGIMLLSLVHPLALAAPQPQNIVVNVSQPTGGAAPASVDVAGQIKALHELKLAGALTDEEFTAQKKKLLG